MSWRTYLSIPQLMMHGLAAPRDQRRAWQRYWSRVRDGEIFWDAGERAEAEALAARLRAHADLTLPIIDLGCGNGGQIGTLTQLAPRVIGIDGAAAAITRASATAGEGVEFRVGDAAEDGLGERLHAEFGDVNVHIRGMLHIVGPKACSAVVRNVAAMLGTRGTAYVCETNIGGNPLDLLRLQGITGTGIPPAMRSVITAGVRRPRHFGQAEVAAHFPPEGWRVLESGPAVIYAVPLRAGGPLVEVPAHYAILRTSA
ncbi:class I SAM-dependent methyltransferase [Dactylosporangium sp. NPDC048998]|uniref:class I SAM-dependent methyltransferase n=1 Tax=Dactylosporangium sp. NPDC048998 TaxID=3363976 RepID=UPI003714F399